MTQEITVSVEDVHHELFSKFIPFYGKTVGEVINNLAIRQLETIIENEKLMELVSKKE